MTAEDFAYASWLDVLGSSTEEGPVLTRALHALHEAAEASHKTPAPAAEDAR